MLRHLLLAAATGGEWLLHKRARPLHASTHRHGRRRIRRGDATQASEAASRFDDIIRPDGKRVSIAGYTSERGRFMLRRIDMAAAEFGVAMLHKRARPLHASTPGRVPASKGAKDR